MKAIDIQAECYFDLLQWLNRSYARFDKVDKADVGNRTERLMLVMLSVLAVGFIKNDIPPAHAARMLRQTMLKARRGLVSRGIDPESGQLPTEH